MSTKRRWFVHVLKASLRQRMGRALVAALSIAIATGVLAGSLGLSLGIRQKLGGELKAYGANAIVHMPNGYIEESSLEEFSAIKGIEEYSGQIYFPITVNGVDVELIGVDAKKHFGWKIRGRMPEAGEALIGADLKSVTNAQSVSIKTTDREFEFRIAGLVESGGAEDRAVIVGLKDAQKIASLEGRVSAVLIRARPDALSQVLKDISKMIPSAEVKTLRQVAYAEEAFLGKIELLMLMVTIVVVVASGISVASTMSATVLERIKEIGLMKALGATRATIRKFYLAEATLIGLAGGASGFALGFATAQAVSRGAFGSFVQIPFYLIFVSILAGVLIAVFASSVPMRSALRQSPALVLRGE